MIAASRALTAAALVIALLLTFALGACSTAPVRPSESVIELRDAELAFSTSDAEPLTGWRPARLPLWSLKQEARAKENGGMTVWLRFRFDGHAVGPGPHALYTEDVAERYNAWLNGRDIHRTYTGKDDLVMGWNRPVLTPLPADALRRGQNELILRVDSGMNWFLSAGHVKIASLAALRDTFDRQHFWRIEAVEIANFSLLALTCLTFLFWFARRRREPELLWAAIGGILYLIRGSIFYFEKAPFDPVIYGMVAQAALFFLPPVGFAFYAELLDIHHKKRWNLLWFSLSTFNVILAGFLIFAGKDINICILILLVTATCSTLIQFRPKYHNDNVVRNVMFGACVLILAIGAIDVGRLMNLQPWISPGFFLQPYSGILVFAAFFALIARRFLTTLSAVETMNITLAARVEAATAALATSEAARRQLEVKQALESERERLMREVHDGIGSNLVTALAVAQKEKLPEPTIGVLRRAVSDLKITVDSLDPMKGDVLALLGNLRHRLEPDLTRAGIESRWQVQSCPPLAWLDSANALHFLRLMQEAASNAIAHSGGKLIIFECAPNTLDSAPGILIAITDDGNGFTRGRRHAKGKGLTNMEARAKALGGVLEFDTAPGNGTRAALWLPMERRMEPR